MSDEHLSPADVMKIVAEMPAEERERRLRPSREYPESEATLDREDRALYYLVYGEHYEKQEGRETTGREKVVCYYCGCDLLRVYMSTDGNRVAYCSRCGLELTIY